MNHWSILGSGVTALCAATVLHAYGQSVELIESSQHATASYWAGGMLAPYCEAESAPPFICKHSLNSILWWQQHSQQVQQNGTLVIAPARDQAELKRFASRTQQHQWCQPQQIETDLSHLSQGLFFPTEAHLDPRLALTELKNRLIEQGVEIHTHRPTGKIIDCRGIYAQDQQSELRAVRGEMLILHNPTVQFKRPIRLLHPRFPCYLVPRREGHYMLGATMLESQDRSPMSARSMLELLSAAYSIHPSFAEARIIETGVGLRPAYNNNIPQLRYHQQRFYLNGMHRHGFLFAPVLAQQLLQQIQGQSI